MKIASQTSHVKGRAGLAALEVMLVLAVMLPVAVVIFVILARLGKWFYFLITNTVGSPLF